MQPDYNFWRDLFDTYQSLTPLLQALWLIVPPTFVVTVLALCLQPRRRRRRHRHDQHPFPPTHWHPSQHPSALPPLEHRTPPLLDITTEKEPKP
jgi:hypothetical protein